MFQILLRLRSCGPARRSIDRVTEEIRAELDRQSKRAHERLQDPRFFDGATGRHVAKDELLALTYLRSIDIEAQAGEVRPRPYLQRLLIEALGAKERFTEQEEDSDGFGAATFWEFIKVLESRSAR